MSGFEFRKHVNEYEERGEGAKENGRKQTQITHLLVGSQKLYNQTLPQFSSLKNDDLGTKGKIYWAQDT